MMFGTVFVIALVLIVIEAVGYWHARNILDEAAAEGARVAAAFDGTCPQGEAESDRLIAARAQGWAQGADPNCREAGGIVTMTVSAGTPGFIFGAVGFSVTVTQSAPREQ